MRRGFAQWEESGDEERIVCMEHSICQHSKETAVLLWPQPNRPFSSVREHAEDHRAVLSPARNIKRNRHGCPARDPGENAFLLGKRVRDGNGLSVHAPVFAK
jgi:hypothetical protein